MAPKSTISLQPAGPDRTALTVGTAVVDDDASPVGAGRVARLDRAEHTMGWVQAGFILYAFAAPSAVMAVPYAVGMAGYLGGMLICIGVTAASVMGAMMLLKLKLCHSECHTFGDLGLQVFGRSGQIFGNVIQLGNFCLFMPCALQFCALALDGIGTGIPAFNGCTDYYVFVIAFICLLTTQVRTFSNTQILSIVSTICVFAMAAIMIVASFKYDNANKVPAYLFGNPENGSFIGLIKCAGGFTINAWAYVPGFLTVELCTCMAEPKHFMKSLILSGVLNVLVFAVVGITVVANWGYNVGEVIGITAGVAAWTSGAAISTAFNCFQLTGNFISYMLDSVPLGRFCQKNWAPGFADTWSPSDILRYFGYTLPTFLLALAISILVPSVNMLLDCVTMLTTPWVSQLFPAALYWKFRQERAPLLEAGNMNGNEAKAAAMGMLDKLAIIFVFLVGSISFVICSLKAIGFIVIEELRPPLQIGCTGWLIWSGR